MASLRISDFDFFWGFDNQTRLVSRQDRVSGLLSHVSSW